MEDRSPTLVMLPRRPKIASRSISLEEPLRYRRLESPVTSPTSSVIIPFSRLPSISTPSPSDCADGQKVDEEIAKLRKLSVEYARSRREAEIEHAIENIRRSRSRSPSLPRDRLKALLSACGNGSPDDNVLPNGPLQAQNSNQHTLPRYFTRARSPLREGSPARSINSKLHNHHPPIVPPSARKFSLPDKEEHFLPVTLPDLPPYKMPATPSQNRRFSEESHQRRPLAVLHEDEVMARRRYSDDIRKKSYDTGPIMDDFASHQRKLSEAGIRRLSDASVVLTEDTDSFIIGDRVWVGGTKPGVISYIGEIQFAPGEWAGVTLDEPIGKNDGSVGGVRYFQCEPKKGVFSRLTRLSRAPLSDYDVDSYLSSVSGGHDSSRANGARSGSSASTSSCLMGLRRPSAPVNHAASPAPSSLPRKTSSGAASPVSAASELKVGERVVVNSTTGVKYGTLRYYGKTEFAEGVWAGVELDEPTGKNDGSVAGKRYFDCKASFGLFAPVGRVTRYTGTTHRTSATGIPSHRMPTSCLRHSGSRESLGASSVASSTASSVRGTRRPSAPSTTSVTNTKALQGDDAHVSFQAKVETSVNHRNGGLEDDLDLDFVASWDEAIFAAGVLITFMQVYDFDSLALLTLKRLKRELTATHKNFETELYY